MKDIKPKNCNRKKLVIGAKMGIWKCHSSDSEEAEVSSMWVVVGVLSTRQKQKRGEDVFG